jgi:hypothetical protein
VTNLATASTRFGNPGAEIFVQPIETILRFNAGILTAFQSATVGWMQRRQEAARDTMVSFGKLAQCRDISEAMTIQREWVKRTMHRLDEDFSPLAMQAPDLLHATMPEAAPVAARVVESQARAVVEALPKAPSPAQDRPSPRTKRAKSSPARKR